MNMDDIFEQFFGGGGMGGRGGGGGFHFNFGGPGGGGHRQEMKPQYEDIFSNSDVIKLNLGTVF
jgi:hypothetical protein